jgi:hypothetical protein
MLVRVIEGLLYMEMLACLKLNWLDVCLCKIVSDNLILINLLSIEVNIVLFKNSLCDSIGVGLVFDPVLCSQLNLSYFWFILVNIETKSINDHIFLRYEAYWLIFTLDHVFLFRASVMMEKSAPPSYSISLGRRRGWCTLQQELRTINE